MCNCGCTAKKQEETPAEDKSYICTQCNVFKQAPADAPAPECCGKKMAEMD
jgi:hypothetical protein